MSQPTLDHVTAALTVGELPVSEHRVSPVAERLERLAGEQDLDASRRALVNLEAEFARVLPALSRLTTELQATVD